jgi:hypothetical protein
MGKYLLTSLAILSERLDLCCLDSSAPYPDGAFDYNSSNHGENGCWWQIGNFMFTPGKKFFD